MELRQKEKPPPAQSSSQPSPWRVEGSRDEPRERPRPWRTRGFWIVLILMLILNYVLGALLAPGPERRNIPYSFFRSQVQADNVADVESRNDTIQGTFRTTVQYPPGSQAKEVKRFQTVRPSLGDDGLLNLLLEKKVSVNAKRLDKGRPWWETLLVGFGPTLLLVALFVLLARRAAAAGGGVGGLGGLGRSRARRYEHSGQRTTFAGVAGIDEVKEELAEIVEFLRQPDRFRRLGATIPKGVLLTGPPGTGKTLLARALAGEAAVPFYSISASEFIEMVVGVGASRVRDLFEQANRRLPRSSSSTSSTRSGAPAAAGR